MEPGVSPSSSVFRRRSLGSDTAREQRIGAQVMEVVMDSRSFDARNFALQITPQPYAAHSGRPDHQPCFFNSLATCTCRHAGSSMTTSTALFSISSAIRFLKSGLLREISCSAASPPFSESSLEPIKAVPAVAQHSARLRHVAQLLTPLQKPPSS